MDVLPYGRRIKEILLIFGSIFFFVFKRLLLVFYEIVNKSMLACLKRFSYMVNSFTINELTC